MYLSGLDFKKYWNVTVYGTGNIKATASTFGLLFYVPMVIFLLFSKSTWNPHSLF